MANASSSRWSPASDGACAPSRQASMNILVANERLLFRFGVDRVLVKLAE